jgi:hypothetical protein
VEDLDKFFEGVPAEKVFARLALISKFLYYISERSLSLILQLWLQTQDGPFETY